MLALHCGSLGALCLHYYIEELTGSGWNKPPNRIQQMSHGKVGGEDVSLPVKLRGVIKLI